MPRRLEADGWEQQPSLTPGSDRLLSGGLGGPSSTPELARPYAPTLPRRRREPSSLRRKEAALVHRFESLSERSSTAEPHLEGEEGKRGMVLRRELIRARHALHTATDSSQKLRASRDHERVARQMRVQDVLTMPTSSSGGSWLSNRLASEVVNNPLTMDEARHADDSMWRACMPEANGGSAATGGTATRAWAKCGSGKHMAAAKDCADLRASRLESLAMSDLLQIKSVFHEHARKGSPVLNLRSFADAFAGDGKAALCRPEEAQQLFSAMDSNSTGFVGWDEFLSYMVQHNAQAVQLREESRRKSYSVLESPPFGPAADIALRHPYPMSGVMRMANSKYLLSTSRDGTLAWWDGETLQPVRTIVAQTCTDAFSRCGSHWPLASTLVLRDCFERTGLLVGSNNRSLLLYDVHSHDPSKYELKGRVPIASVPLAVTYWEERSAKWVSIGDENGCVLTYDAVHLTDVARRCHPTPPFPRPTLRSDPSASFNRVHTDWVSSVQYVPHLPSGALVSASLDATLKVLDVEQNRVKSTLAGHSRGIHCFHALNGPQVCHSHQHIAPPHIHTLSGAPAPLHGPVART